MRAAPVGSALRERPAAPAGYVVGGTYLSVEAGERYTVEAVTTLWECAPAGAVVVRWSNGNRTIRSGSPGSDPLVCPRCDAAVTSEDCPRCARAAS